MRFLLLISLLIVALLACNNGGTGSKEQGADSLAGQSSADSENAVSSSRFIHKFRDTVLESRIADTLMKLSFVKKTDHYMDSLTDHKHGISFIMDSVGTNEVSVIAGYNGPERFETYYSFAIYPKTFDIMIEYPDTGELVPIEQYIKLNKE